MTKYKEIFPDMLITHMAEGRSFLAFGAKANVSRKTLYEWLDQYPVFAEAKAVGELKSLYYWEEVAASGAIGQIQNFNASMTIFTLKCRFSKYGYKETPVADDEDVNHDLTSVPTEKILERLRLIPAKK